MEKIENHFRTKIKTFTILNAAVIIISVVFLPNILVHADYNVETRQLKLATILNKTKQYCEMLERAAFDFICLEEISETLVQPKLIEELVDIPGRTQMRYEKRVVESKEKNKYVYDYQLIRKDSKTKEIRILLKENGKKKNVKDAKLKTQYVRYENEIFGPNILSAYWQNYYDYKILKKEKTFGIRAIILEATPKRSLEKKYPYGKIWVSESDFSVLKIEWDRKSIRFISGLEERAKGEKADLFVTAKTEYKVEKNGIRFPSRFQYEITFVKEDDEKPMRIKTDVKYKNYKFFSVETEVKYDSQLCSTAMDHFLYKIGRGESN